MDEILIEEKKYISSKQAAKVTGYAKDYVGQLCREGRVPARLVGRSWYVLESAIQDHRFGDVEIEPEKSVKAAPAVANGPATWESPRYEAVSEELLPSLNRLKNTTINAAVSEQEENQETTDQAQDSWKEWFDRLGFTEGVVEVKKVEEQAEATEEKVEKDESEESENVRVPIHAVYHPAYQAPPDDLLPRTSSVVTPASREATARRKSSRLGIRTFQLASIILALVLAGTALIGSGYFDAYILSNNQVSSLAGVYFYNK